MTYGAFGLVEVVGSSNAILVIDQMLKTSEVSFRTWQTKCGGHATVFMSGDVSAVTAAVESIKGNPPILPARPSAWLTRKQPAIILPEQVCPDL